MINILKIFDAAEDCVAVTIDEAKGRKERMMM